MMTSLQIVRFRDGWTLSSGGRKWGRFAYRVDAEEAALRLARRAEEQGEFVQILVQDPRGAFTPMNVPKAG